MLLSGIFCQRELKVVHYFNLSNERGFLYLHIFIHGPFIHLSSSLYPMHGGRRAEPILAIMGQEAVHNLEWLQICSWTNIERQTNMALNIFHVLKMALHILFMQDYATD